MVGDAFSRSNLATQVCLFVLRLSASEYFRRFDKAQWERFGGAYGYKDQTGDQRRRRAAKLQDEFLHSDLEIPVNGVVPVIECRDDDMLLEEMQSFFTNTSQFE